MNRSYSKSLRVQIANTLDLKSLANWVSKFPKWWEATEFLISAQISLRTLLGITWGSQCAPDLSMLSVDSGLVLTRDAELFALRIQSCHS